MNKKSNSNINKYSTCCRSVKLILTLFSTSSINIKEKKNKLSKRWSACYSYFQINTRRRAFSTFVSSDVTTDWLIDDFLSTQKRICSLKDVINAGFNINSVSTSNNIFKNAWFVKLVQFIIKISLLIISDCVTEK